MNHLCSKKSKWTPWLLAAAAVLVGLFTGIDTTRANDTGVSGQPCIRDALGVYTGNMCTANDVRLGVFTLKAGPTSCTLGQPIEVTLKAVIESAPEKNDVGIWLDQEGGNALDAGAGSPGGNPSLSVNRCYRDYLKPMSTDNSTVDLAGGLGDFYNAEVGTGDACGDLPAASAWGVAADKGPCTEGGGTCVFTHYIFTTTILCRDADGDGIADVGAAATWNNDGPICENGVGFLEGTLPGGSSKCVSASTEIAGLLVPGGIVVDKVTLDAYDNPVSDPTLFGFGITGPDGDLPDEFQLAGGDPPHESPELDTPGNYSVAETSPLPDGWELAGANCVSNLGNSDQDPTAGDVTVEKGEILTCTFTNQKLVAAPDLTVRKDNDADGDDSYSDTETYPGTSPGDFPATVPYQVQVTNSSISDATITAIDDDTHDITGTTCADLLGDTIAAGETKTCTFNGTFSNAEQSVTNTFAVTAENDEGSDTAEDSSTVNFVPTPAIDLEKKGTLDMMAAGAPGIANPGDIINYTFQVSNTGNLTVYSVSMTDPDVSPISCPGGSPIPLLSPGDSVTCTGSYALTQDDIDAGQKLNNATASGKDPSGAPVEDSDDEAVDIPQNPVLSVDKVLTNNADEDSSGDISLGDTLTYQITASNDGNVTLHNVHVSDDLAGDSTSCPAVAPGGTCVLTVTYVVTQVDVDAGEIVNTGTAGSDETDPTEDPNTEPVPQDPSVEILKSGTFNDEGGDGNADAGETVSYEFAVTNDGNVTLSTVSVSDLKVSPISCPSSNPIPSMAPGDYETCTGSYTLTQNDVNAGQVDNTVIASGTDPGGDPVEDTDDEIVDLPINPSVEILKSGTFNDEGGDGYADTGETISYEFAVTNDGNVTLSNVSVSDPKISPISCPSGNPLPAMAPGDSETCTGSYTLTQPDVDAGEVDNTATASGKDPDQNDVADSDVETVRLPVNPSVEILKTGTFNDEGGDGYADAGETISYEFDVTNDGNASLSNVSVSDPKISPISCPSGNPIPSMAPGGSETCTGSYTLVQADLDTGKVDNTATASGKDPDQNDVADSDGETVNLPLNPSVEILKSGTFNDESGDGFANAGETISYDFDVTNDGNVTLSNVSVSDPKISPISCPSGNPIPAMNPGDSETCTGSYTLTQPDVNAGQVDNIATAAGKDPDQNDVVDSDAESIDLVLNASVEIIKSGTFNDEGGDGYANPGETISYEFAVTNDGNVTLSNVFVSDPKISPISCPSGNPIPTMNPGDSETCSGSYTLFQPDVDAGQVDNTATASGKDPDQNDVADSNSESVNLPLDPSIEIVKSGTFSDEGGDGYADASETISYEFAVTNDGNVTLSNVSVSDPKISPISCPSGNPIPSMAPGDSETCTGSYTLTQPDVDAGKIDNTASAAGKDPDQNDVTDSDSETVNLPLNPSIEILKSGTFNDEGGDGYADAGETISYEFAVTNDGNVTLSNVSVSDPKISPISCPSGNPIPSMAPGDFETCTGSYTLTQPDVDAARVENTASASGQDPDDDPVEDTDEETVDLPRNPALSVDKELTNNADEDGSGTISLGDTLTYQITATNDGNVTLHNVAISDDLTGDTTTCQSVAPEDTCVLTVTYVVTQADVDASEIVNTGTADSDETGPAVDPNREPVAQNPVLSVDKELTNNADEDGSGAVSLGDTLTYQITASNDGSVTLHNVVVTDDLTGDRTTCPAVAPGGTCVLTVTYRVTQGDVEAGQVVNTGTADSDETDAVEDPHIVLIPRLEVVKTVLPQLIVPGQILEYEFFITNPGIVDLDPVRVTDTLPTGFEYVPSSGDPSDPDLISGQDLIWENLGPLGKGDSIRVSYDATVTQQLQGAFVNVVAATGESPAGPVADMDSESVDITQPEVDVNKMAVAWDTDIYPPNYVTYTIAIKNVGISTIAEMRLEDTFDPGLLSFTWGEPMPNSVVGGDTLVWNDLTGPTPNGFDRDLPPGDHFLVTTVFLVTKNITRTDNTAEALEIVDVYDNPAPPASDTETIINVPTLIELLSFAVHWEDTQIVIEWETAWERNNWGFDLLRTTEPGFKEAEWILFQQAQGWGQFEGESYWFADADVVPCQRYFYWLEDVDMSGERTRHGPVQAASPCQSFLPLVMK